MIGLVDTGEKSERHLTMRCSGLFDLAQIDEQYVTGEEQARGLLERNERRFYTNDLELVKDNFSQWNNIQIIAG